MRQSFPSWMFPGVPADARIVYARGASRLGAPAGGGAPFSVFLADTSGHGDATGNVFNLARVAGSNVKARLVGLGIGVRGAGRPLHYGVTLAGAGSAAIASNLVVASTDGALPEDVASVGFMADEIQVSSSTDVYVQIGGVNLAIASFQGGPWLSRDFRVQPGLSLVDPAGGGVNAVLVNHTTDRPHRGLDIDLVKTRVDANGANLAGAYQRVGLHAADGGEIQILRPHQKLELRPVQAEGDALLLAEHEAFTIGLERTAASELPDDAYVVTEMAVAIWTP